MADIHQAWPNTKHQRCLFHVWMNIRQKLTFMPKIEAGIELWILKKLLKIEGMVQKENWLKTFEYEEFVKG